MKNYNQSMALQYTVEIQVDNHEAANIIRGKKVKLKEMNLIRKINIIVTLFREFKVLQGSRKVNRSFKIFCQDNFKVKNLKLK